MIFLIVGFSVGFGLLLLIGLAAVVAYFCLPPAFIRRQLLRLVTSLHSEAQSAADNDHLHHLQEVVIGYRRDCDPPAGSLSPGHSHDDDNYGSTQLGQEVCTSMYVAMIQRDDPSAMILAQ